MLKAILFVNPGQDADDPENAGPIPSLNIERSIAYIENFPHVVNASGLHSPEDHVWSGPPLPDVIATDIGNERVLPA